MKDAAELAAEAAEALAGPDFRPRDSRGRPGGLLELPSDLELAVIGDLHACGGNLDLILAHRGNRAALEGGRLRLLFLGDAVHNDVDYREMDTSILLIERIMALIAGHPGRVFYLRGNHDSFGDDVMKGGVLQGLEFGAAVLRRRGRDCLAAMQLFFDRLPLAALGEGFLAVHAGPPRGGCGRGELIEALSSPALAMQLVWNRAAGYPGWPAGMTYAEGDLASARSRLGLGPRAHVIVGHTPLGDIEATGGFWRDAFGYSGHHILFSAARSRAPYLSITASELRLHFAKE